jgi:AcrR family transcriptional regulator
MPRAATAAPADAEAPSGPRSRKGTETRTRLVDAAKLVFEEEGFLKARIGDISQRAGLSHGSFYNYFESKEQIFREVADTQERLLTLPAAEARPAETRRRGGVSPRERIREANRLYLERYRQEARLMGVIEQVSRYDDHVNAGRMARMKLFAERAERNIKRLQKDGLVDKDLDPSIAATALGAMVARFAELWLVQGYADYDFDEAVEQLTALWCNALGLEMEPRRRRTSRRLPR